jgi:hypothetical protein
MSADLLKIKRREEIVKPQTHYENHETQHIKNFPDPPPKATHLPEIAELTGRYSVGSHNNS